MSSQSITPSQRYLLLDLIRFICVISISVFHLVEFSESITYPDIFNSSFFAFHIIDVFKWVCLQGYTVFFLAFFLVGFKGLKKKTLMAYSLFAVFGYFIILFGFYQYPYPMFYWDVYPFLLFTLLTLFAFHRYRFMIFVWLGFSLLTSYFNPLQLNSEILGGICTPEYQSSWPLFPWLFFAGFLFEWGKLIAKKTIYWRKRALSVLTFLFMGLLFVSIIHFNSFSIFATVSATSDLYCKIQTLGFLAKLTLLVGWTWMFLASLYFQPQNQLLKLISKSLWNKNFGLAYLLHILIIIFFINQADFFLSSGLSLDIAWLSMLITLEIIGLLLKPILLRFHKINM